jgi:G3E family GTPase
MNSTLPVHLITGLLGSGKTTCLKHLIQQKPVNENWVILINEFGEIDIDASQLVSNTTSNTIDIHAVSGGCICCTAQLGLVNTLNKLFRQTTTKIDRIWIEPTGLGHPAKIIDALQKSPFLRALSLQKISCIITPQQLTPQRWQKSKVMRDLVTLADTIILNKTDLSNDFEITQALNILKHCYPEKPDIIATQFGEIPLDNLLEKRVERGINILSIQNTHQAENEDLTHNKQIASQQTPYESAIPKTRQCYISLDNSADIKPLLSMGWIWSNEIQFNRVKLKALFEKLAPHLLRAKGIMKTGNEWQLINWSDGILSFEEIAWRQDSRLECLFTHNKTVETIHPTKLEEEIQSTIHSYNS